jgi:hypothetical protein
MKWAENELEERKAKKVARTFKKTTKIINNEGVNHG